MLLASKKNDGPIVGKSRDKLVFLSVNYISPIQGKKNRKFRPIFRFSVGVEKNFHGKNRLKKIRRKITDFSEKIGKMPKFHRFFGVYTSRTGERVWRRFFRRFFGDKLKKSPIYRRFISCFLTFRFVPVLIQRSRFRPPFLNNPTAIFVIQRLILNLKLDLTV